jgi:predicted dehydrogenase
METNRNEKIGVGIIGLSAGSGWAGMAHIPALRASPGYEIRALSASNQVSAAAAAKKYDIPLFFDNATDLVHRPEVELAIVSVKVPEHRELVETVLRAGKMVYCEWPLAKNLSEAKALSNLAREKNIPSFIGLQARAVPAVRFLRDLILEDYVGEVLST